MIKRFIRITRAILLRNFHCFWHTLKLDMRHQMYSEGNSTILKLGNVLKTKMIIPDIEIWFEPTHVGCTCGKDFYGKSKFEIQH